MTDIGNKRVLGVYLSVIYSYWREIIIIWIYLFFLKFSQISAQQKKSSRSLFTRHSFYGWYYRELKEASQKPWVEPQVRGNNIKNNNNNNILIYSSIMLQKRIDIIITIRFTTYQMGWGMGLCYLQTVSEICSKKEATRINLVEKKWKWKWKCFLFFLF